MKNVFIALFIAGSASSWAQGNLQFSQVKLVGSTETVPAGKVWKVSNILPSDRLTSAAGGGTTGQTLTTTHVIVVNGNNVVVASSDSRYSVDAITITERGGSTAGSGTRPVSAATATSESILNGAIWLPEETTLAAGSGVYRVSVLEFTIVP